jgi:apolipoprotein N-acyltransferase
MWKPWSADSARLHLVPNKVLPLREHRAAIFICYESLLPWSYLWVASQHPTLFVVLSNLYWVRNSPAPTYQSACARSWARAFHVSLLEASNW